MKKNSKFEEDPIKEYKTIFEKIVETIKFQTRKKKINQEIRKNSINVEEFKTANSRYGISAEEATKALLKFSIGISSPSEEYIKKT